MNYGHPMSDSATSTHLPCRSKKMGSYLEEGLIFALEAKTGKVLWKHKIGNSLISTVVPLSGNRILFTATGGEAGLLKFKIKK